MNILNYRQWKKAYKKKYGYNPKGKRKQKRLLSDRWERKVENKKQKIEMKETEKVVEIVADRKTIGDMITILGEGLKKFGERLVHIAETIRRMEW